MRRRGFRVDGSSEDSRWLAMASLRAIAVAEFLEKSPARSVKSPVFRQARRSLDLAKEPLLVEGAKIIFGRGGSWPRRMSGR